MKALTPTQREEITARARTLGASSAGIAPLGPVLDSPSVRAEGPVSPDREKGSVLVLALAHPADRPDLDFWGGSRGTEGNRELMRISEELAQWLAAGGIEAGLLPYRISQGGLYVKDAAVLAGLGVIGRGNLLVTPEHGPRVRLRALWMGIETQAPPPPDFSPCDGCHEPCRSDCPQEAFGSDGFLRPRCRVQMDADVEAGRIRQAGSEGRDGNLCVAYCRVCELACPVGASDAEEGRSR
jgi:hypothetical protein